MINCFWCQQRADACLSTLEWYHHWRGECGCRAVVTTSANEVFVFLLFGDGFDERPARRILGVVSPACQGRCGRTLSSFVDSAFESAEFDCNAHNSFFAYLRLNCDLCHDLFETRRQHWFTCVTWDVMRSYIGITCQTLTKKLPTSLAHCKRTTRQGCM